MHGQFSMKSDVYSFGVLVLEIISGKMNSSFNQTDGSTGNLVTHVSINFVSFNYDQNVYELFNDVIIY